MSVTVPGRAVKARHHHERPVETDHADHVFQHGLPIPAPERLLDRLGVAVVNGGGEVEVVQAVVAPRENELACADQSKRVEELGADRVGAGLAAVKAEQRRAGAPPAAGQREHAGVLVVGVRGHMEDAGRGGELADPVPGAGSTPVGLQFLAGDRGGESEDAVEGWPSLGGGGRRDGGEGNGHQVRARETPGRGRLRDPGSQAGSPPTAPASAPGAARPTGAGGGGRPPARHGLRS